MESCPFGAESGTIPKAGCQRTRNVSFLAERIIAPRRQTRNRLQSWQTLVGWESCSTWSPWWPPGDYRGTNRSEFATGFVCSLVKPQPCSGAGRKMHLLIIILQQLLGMLPSSKQAPQAEVVRRERPQPKSSEADACLRLARPITGWMSVLTLSEGLRPRPPCAATALRDFPALSVVATATTTPTRPVTSRYPSLAD